MPVNRQMNFRCAGRRAAVDFVEQCRQMPSSERHTALVHWLQEQVAAVLRCGIDRVVPDKALRSLGLDSLMALELRNRLERGLYLKLSATLAWNYPTVTALAAHLEGKIEGKTATGSQTQAQERGIANLAEREEVLPKAPSGHETQESPGKLSGKPAQSGAPDLSAAELLEAELLGVQSLLSK